MVEAKIDYQIMPSKSRIPTVKAQVGDDSSFYLHSTIQPREEGEEWVKRLELTTDTCYIVLGAGLGYHIQALLEKLPANSIVWVLMTPSEVELVNYSGARSEYNWLTDKRMSILRLTNIHDMALLIANSMIEHRIKIVCLCKHFPAMRLAAARYEEIKSTLVPILRKIMALNFNMKVAVEHKFFSNYWKNFTDYVLNPGSRSWKGAFAGLPVIIVAAGPSLNKNIAELKKCTDKAVIIAAGSALGALHKHGITPDFLIVTDGNPIMYEVLKDFFSAETILLATTSVEPQVVANYPGPKCFFDTWVGHDGAFKKYLPETIWISQTTSVATAAVDFANKCSARTIILVGQDLAFPAEGHHHADGARAGGFDGWSTIKVPGYYGEEVNSTDQFKMIIAYYNAYMNNNSQIDFINATEGGALIASMRNLPLATVHREMLKDSINKDKMLANFKHQSGEMIEVKKIVEHLHKMSKWIKTLSDQVQEFSNKEEGIIKQRQTTQDKITLQDIQRFEIFCMRIKRRNIYPYIASSIESWLALFKFQVSDGMPVHLQYEFYWNVIRDIQRMMVDLTLSLTETIKKLDYHERGLG